MTPYGGQTFSFQRGPPVVNKYIFIEHSGLGLKVEITRVITKLRNCLHRFLSGQNTLIWPLHIPIISQSVSPPSNSKLGQTPPNFSKLLQTPSKLFQTLSALVQTLSKRVQTCPNTSKCSKCIQTCPNFNGIFLLCTRKRMYKPAGCLSKQ